MSTPSTQPHSPIPHPASRPSHSNNPQPAIRNPQSAIVSPITLFSTVYLLARDVLGALTRRHTLSVADSIRIICKLSECSFSLMRIQLTLIRKPQRFDPRQVIKLSRAAAVIARLAGRPLDFSPWLALSPAQLDQLCPPAISPSLKPPKSSPKNERCINFRNFQNVPRIGPVATPGATLARICINIYALAQTLGFSLPINTQDSAPGPRATSPAKPGPQPASPAKPGPQPTPPAKPGPQVSSPATPQSLAPSFAPRPPKFSPALLKTAILPLHLLKT